MSMPRADGNRLWSTLMDIGPQQLARVQRAAIQSATGGILGHVLLCGLLELDAADVAV